jgi:TRAP transporter TAXI family solute receptor
MSTRMTTRLSRLGAALVAATLLVSGCAVQASTTMVNGIRDPLVITTYGSTTSTYADVAAVADKVSVDSGARIRIITSDTGIGRMAALRSGAASIGRLGQEAAYSFEGVFEFANEDWGPQPNRMIWTPLSADGMLSRSADGIDTPADLKGKKVPLVTANPSVNGKIDAYLAYSGLSRDDVVSVPMAYGEQAEALEQGRIDALYQGVYGASLFELASQTDVSWIDLDPDNDEGLKRVIAKQPSVNIGTFSGAPGQASGEESGGFVYSLPFAADASMSDDEVFDFITAVAENYPKYKDSTVNTPRFDPKLVESMPKEVPFHPGYVRWLKEHRQWSDEAQRRQDELLERGKRLDTEWDAFLDAEDPSEDDFFKEWLKWKESHDLGLESEKGMADLGY